MQFDKLLYICSDKKESAHFNNTNTMIDYLNKKKMKALKNNPLVIAIPLLMVEMISVSCTKDKKPTYSCNPKINNTQDKNI